MTEETAIRNYDSLSTKNEIEVNKNDDNDDDVNLLKSIPTESDFHFLQNKWTFYFFKNDRSKEWIDNMKKVIDFETVEDFWGLMNHIAPPSKLPSGCDYYVFKHDIEPMWEDERNKNGGMWLLSFEKAQRASQLDPCWLEVLMLLVGEAFGEDGEEVCGAVVNIRGKGDRVSVWTADCQSAEAIKRVGLRVKEALGLSCSIEYTAHTDAQSKSSSRAKCTFRI